jgi:hypothetical protein
VLRELVNGFLLAVRAGGTPEVPSGTDMITVPLAWPWCWL